MALLKHTPSVSAPEFHDLQHLSHRWSFQNGKRRMVDIVPLAHLACPNAGCLLSSDMLWAVGADINRNLFVVRLQTTVRGFAIAVIRETLHPPVKSISPRRSGWPIVTAHVCVVPELGGISDREGDAIVPRVSWAADFV